MLEVIAKNKTNAERIEYDNAKRKNTCTDRQYPVQDYYYRKMFIHECS